MLDKKVSSLLNEQINKELYSSYLYLDMANFYSEEGLDGFENYFFVQAQEERDHALLIREYMKDNGEKITLGAIDKPDAEFKELIDPLNKTLEHERFVTSLIHDIYAAAVEAHDYRTMQFLDWFVKEQMEEEKNADDYLKKFKRFANDSKGLYMLDNELGSRTYTATTTTE